MLVPRHDTGPLAKLSDGDLIHLTHSFAGTIRVNPAFENLPEHVPGADRFTALGSLLGVKSEAAKHGDKLQGEERDKVREELIMSFIIACQHSVMVAMHRKDPSLMNVGFSLIQRHSSNKHATNALPGQPTKVEAKSGPKGSRIVWVIVNKIAGMGSVEVQYTENPNDESSWISAERSYKCKVELKLDLVKRYYIRVRYHNNSGYGPWSSVIDIVLS